MPHSRRKALHWLPLQIRTIAEGKWPILTLNCGLPLNSYTLRFKTAFPKALGKKITTNLKMYNLNSNWKVLKGDEFLSAIVDVTAARFWHYLEYLLYWLLSDFFPHFPSDLCWQQQEGDAWVSEVCPFPLSNLTWLNSARNMKNGRRRFPKLLFRAAQEGS